MEMQCCYRFFVAFEVGLCEEKYAKKIKEYVCIKKINSDSVCVKEKDEINRLKESENLIYPKFFFKLPSISLVYRAKSVNDVTVLEGKKD